MKNKYQCENPCDDTFYGCRGCVNALQERHDAMMEFINKVKSQSCCNVCNCLSCDAKQILEEIGEL